MDDVRLISRDCGHELVGTHHDVEAGPLGGAGVHAVAERTAPREGVVTVVLADDSDVYRRGMRRAIEADARLALVAEVTDGAAALAAIRELQPDVALLDLQMPALDGVEVCRRIRADPPPRRPRFVLVTAFLSDDMAARARACGMDHQLDKTTPRRQICDLLAGDPPAPEVQAGLAGEMRTTSSASPERAAAGDDLRAGRDATLAQSQRPQ